MPSIPAHYQPAADLLKDRVIFISGASDGIGRAVALAAAAHGATVLLHGRDMKKLEAVYDQISEAGHPQAAILPLDFATAKPEAYGEIHDWITGEFGRLDGLLHNAALLGDRSPIEHYKPEVWQRLLQVNLTAPFLLSRALLPLLQASDDASIVFTSSSVGRQGRAYWGAYAVSKFGLEGLMQTLADELENTATVRVNSLNPGATNTAMRRSAYPGELPETNPEPAQRANAFLYLLGPDSRDLHGQTLDIA